ncbi:hypothetical protein JCM8208_003828 [Rhodotorula glutinis]
MTATRRQATPPSPSSSLEQYLLLLLSDSNLPTGGFVASSGLESWIQHGNLALTTPDPAPPPSSASPAPSHPHLPTTSRTRPQPEAALLAFVAHSLHSYARLNVPLLRSAHAAVASLLSSSPSSPPPGAPRVDDAASPTTTAIDTALERVLAADALCECMTLNHVARRASTAQGVALLTLYERALAPELPLPGAVDGGGGPAAVGEVVVRYRAAIRAGQGGGKAVEGGNGHMSVAFAVMTAAVGLGLDASIDLFLFLHARSLLSSAVRLNNVGPYVAHRLLLWDVKAVVDGAVAATSFAAPTPSPSPSAPARPSPPAAAADWWDDDPAWTAAWGDDDGTGVQGGPVTSWPLGEIIASRHDQLFTRVFNS